MALALRPPLPPARFVRRRAARRRLHRAAPPSAAGGLLSQALEAAVAAAPQLPRPPAADDVAAALAARAADAAASAASARDAAAAFAATFDGDVLAGLSATEEALSAASAAASVAVAAAAQAAGLSLEAMDGDSRALIAAAAGGASLLAVALRRASPPDGLERSEEQQFRSYNPEATLRYCAARPGAALARAAQVGSHVAGFAVALAADRAAGREEANAPARARQARESLTELGPAFVKIGQVLSARVDLLPAPYLAELKRLQDAVAPFPEEEARAILAAELPAGAFASLSAAPVASASLGQVYRGIVASDGRAVAVKVQRPGVARGIAIDLLLLRFAAPLLQKQRRLNTDLVALVDEWGARFVAELDYTQEAAAGMAFRTAMQSRGLRGAVTAAEVLAPLTTRRVLTTAWVEGTRLDDPSLPPSEARRCVELALAAYLTMLLDTGQLHADPHPGNLMRTPGGQLVILDFGLVTPVTTQQQRAILGYIAHLVGKDYAAIAGDLQAMGFVPESKRAALEDSGVTEILAEVFRALARGGGARKVSAGLRDINAQRLAAEGPRAKGGGRVDALAKDIRYIQEKYGNILQIPSYFAYILRAFSVLEGIGLSADPEFSIAAACYPYVARRLLSDRSASSTAALDGILYGRQGREGPLDVRRVRQLATAFRSYAAATSVEQPPAAGGNGVEAPPALSPAARDALRLAFSPEGGPLQDVLVRELARLAGSAAAAGLAAAGGSVPGRAAAAAAAAQRAAAASLPPWPARWALSPLTLPADVLAAAEPLMKATAADNERLAAAREVADILFGNSSETLGGGGATNNNTTNAATNNNNNNDQKTPPAPETSEVPPGDAVRGALDGAAAAVAQAQRFATAAAPLLPELAPGVAAAALRFGSELLAQAAQRIADADAAQREAAGGDGLGAPPPRV